jgi:hypothetical protein
VADPAPCGTIAAYQRHYYHGEPVCEACREAHNAYRRENDKPLNEAQKINHRAHSRRRYAAVKALIAMYPADFQRLLTQQQEKFR